MTYRQEIGRIGENFAAEYLKRRGYRIIDRNKNRKWGELDIIAVAPDKTLVFVEVKTMRVGDLRPEDQMTSSKIKKFKRAAQIYSASHEELVDERKGWRLDVIALTGYDEEKFEVSHYENI